MGDFNEDRIRRLLNHLLPLLHFLHKNQVIHGNIKPENIIHQRNSHQLFLVDFAGATFGSSDRLREGRVMGDLRYMAPEQAAGKGIFASDLYSLGVTCIHLLTQQHS